MDTLSIFTEGKADVKFLQDIIAHTFKIDLPDNIFDTLNSWAGYKAGGLLNTRIREFFDSGKTILLILDADDDFAARQSEILKDFASYNIPVQLFLFPNHQQNGNLETLLSTIAVDQKLIVCFEQYEACIAQHKQYEMPDIKSKVYAYLDALLPSVNKKGDKKNLLKEENRDYRNIQHWNLEHDFLEPLKKFLSQHVAS